MAKVDTSDFRTGLNLRIEDEIYSIIDFQHVKPGKGGAFVRTKLKGVENEKNIEKTFRAGESVESVRVERQPYQFLYTDGELCFFMNQETYEQTPIEKSRVEKLEFISDGDICTLVVDVDNDRVLYAEPSDHVNMEVVQTDPGLRGDTAQGASKPATLASGAVVQVPLFINEGDVIRVDTRTGEYVERVNTN
ncbi:MAG: elongation factor P [Balneolaceae bacterium]